MREAQHAIRKQLIDLGCILDKEEIRLAALIRLGAGANREHIEARLAAVRTARKRWQEMLTDLEGTPTH